MSHHAWVLEVRPGYEEEYKRRHDEIWPEMLTTLRAAGIRNYSIFRLGLTLIGTFETDDLERSIAALRADPVNARWSEYMAPIMKIEMDLARGFPYPAAAAMAYGLSPVFHRDTPTPALSPREREQAKSPLPAGERWVRGCARIRRTCMKAVAYTQSLPIEDARRLQDVTLPDPVATGRDLLVRVHAVSVNPVDTKVRRRADPGGTPKVLGWDAAGVVEATGPDCVLFRPGDAVLYAGDIGSAGSNSELHLVDERIAGPKPASLSFAETAALPLTAITAWEMLFDRLGVRLGRPQNAGSLLLIGGAGGVGSMAIQLARRLTGLRVIATASRPETRDWCLALGAHDVIDHSGDLAAQLRAIGATQVEVVFSTTNTDRHWAAIGEVVAPQGKVGLIDDPGLIDVNLLKRKSVSLHWELMFTRPVFATPDMIEQHRLLAEVSALVDGGVIRSTLAERFGAINAANLRRAHALIESGTSRGKIVLEGFG